MFVNDPRDAVFPTTNFRSRLEVLRRKHPRLIYDAFEGEPYGNGVRVKFSFRLEPDIEFEPEIVFDGLDKTPLREIPKSVMENLFFHVGLAKSFDYWKAAAPGRDNGATAGGRTRLRPG
jgi:hypothetical protein